jgi:hypothetical protein
LLDGDACTELALGDQFTLRRVTDLAGDEQQVSGAHETNVVGDRRVGLMQCNAQLVQLLLDRSRHGFPQYACHVCPRHYSVRFMLMNRAGHISPIVRPHASTPDGRFCRDF